MELPKPRRDYSFFIGIFLGGLVGAIIIVLLGTEKGKKLARKLQKEGLDFLEDSQDKIEEKFAPVMEKGQEFIEKGIALEQEAVEQMGSLKDEFVGEAAVRADATLKHIEDLQANGREATAQLRKKLFRNIPTKR